MSTPHPPPTRRRSRRLPTLHAIRADTLGTTIASRPRTNPVQIAVDVEFEQIGRIVNRTPSVPWPNALESRRLRQIQFTVYDGGENGAESYYRVHSDTSLLTAGRPTQRKLSAVLQLSPPGDYRGGDLRLVDAVDPPPAAPLRRRGTLVVFPSLLRHEVTSVTAGTRVSLVGWYQGEPWR